MTHTFEPMLIVSVSLKRGEHPHDVDHKVEALLSLPADGGGMMIGGTIRDVDFFFVDPAVAVAAALKVHAWAHAEGRTCSWAVSGGDEHQRRR